MLTRTSMCLLLLLSALLGPFAARATPTYAVTFLPDGFDAHDINNAGQIAGNTLGEAWIWSDTGIVNLSALAPGLQVYALNDRGEAAGTDGGADSAAFIYANGQIRDIGKPPGLNFAKPLALNDKGELAGSAGNFPGDTSRAFVYSGGTMTVIGTFGGDQGQALAINDHGTVVGSTALAPPPDSPYGQERAFVYRDGVLRPITAPNAVVDGANDINDAGAIVGGAFFADTGLGQPYMVVHGVLTNLGGPTGSASGINEHGDIVGVWSVTDSDLTHAFLYRDGRLADLNGLILPEPGWTVTRASDINDAGQILATACFGSTLVCRSVRLDLVPAVPEPAGVALLAGGLGVLAGARRRRAGRGRAR